MFALILLLSSSVPIFNIWDLNVNKHYLYNIVLNVIGYGSKQYKINHFFLAVYSNISGTLLKNALSFDDQLVKSSIILNESEKFT